jgi:hypothetical protein
VGRVYARAPLLFAAACGSANTPGTVDNSSNPTTDEDVIASTSMAAHVPSSSDRSTTQSSCNASSATASRSASYRSDGRGCSHARTANPGRHPTFDPIRALATDDGESWTSHEGACALCRHPTHGTGTRRSDAPTSERVHRRSRPSFCAARSVSLQRTCERDLDIERTPSIRETIGGRAVVERVRSRSCHQRNVVVPFSHRRSAGG